ncbi:MAG TPA: hypothetical protein VLY04_06150 [Bryobacteraceae bacterium]|nr:hypothetical protein [Bryobacteraceae bacterium]
MTLEVNDHRTSFSGFSKVLTIALGFSEFIPSDQRNSNVIADLNHIANSRNRVTFCFCGSIIELTNI